MHTGLKLTGFFVVAAYCAVWAANDFKIDETHTALSKFFSEKASIAIRMPITAPDKVIWHDFNDVKNWLINDGTLFRIGKSRADSGSTDTQESSPPIQPGLET